MHQLELKLRSTGYSGAEIACMPIEELQCRLLHIAYNEAMDELDSERRRLLSAPFTEERELRRALRGIELRSNALTDTFHRKHPAGEAMDGK